MRSGRQLELVTAERVLSDKRIVYQRRGWCLLHRLGWLEMAPCCTLCGEEVLVHAASETEPLTDPNKQSDARAMEGLL